MNNNKINIQVVEENRPSLASFGNIYGRRIFKAAKTPVITDFQSRMETANHTKGLFINRNINRYKVVAIDITSIALKKGIDDDYEIVINEGLVDETGSDIEVRCPITKSDFTEDVTTENLVKALSKDSASGANVFFSSGKKLAKFLNAENDKENAKVRSLVDELNKISQMLDTTSEKNTAYADSYYRQLDGKTGNTTVNITVED